MSDKYEICELRLLIPVKPACISRISYQSPDILFSPESEITMQQAQAICDLLNNWDNTKGEKSG